MDHLLVLVVPPTPMAVPTWLEELLAAGLLERDGCLFLAAYAPTAGSSVPPRLQDRTGWEAVVNHFHIDPVDHSFGDLVLAANAAMHLNEQIELLGLGFSVRVIIGRNLEGELPNSTVRLHRLRPDEISRTADLEQSLVASETHNGTVLVTQNERANNGRTRIRLGLGIQRHPITNDLSLSRRGRATGRRSALAARPGNRAPLVLSARFRNDH